MIPVTRSLKRHSTPSSDGAPVEGAGREHGRGASRPRARRSRREALRRRGRARARAGRPSRTSRCRGPALFWTTRSSFEGLLLARPVGDEHVPALAPLDVEAVLLLPGGEASSASRGRGGSWRARSGWRGCRRWPPCCCPGPAEANWSRQRTFSPFSGQVHGGGHADAPGADDDGVVDGGRSSHASHERRRRRWARRPSSAPRRSTTPANAPSGTSMKTGRCVSGVTCGGGTPSSRKTRAMRLGQVLPPQAPMPARVRALRWFRSRTPSRMCRRISPAVTRSQRQTTSSSSIRCDLFLHRLRDPRLLDPDAGDQLGDLARRLHLHQEGVVRELRRPDLRHRHVPEHLARACRGPSPCPLP